MWAKLKVRALVWGSATVMEPMLVALSVHELGVESEGASERLSARPLGSVLGLVLVQPSGRSSASVWEAQSDPALAHTTACQSWGAA